MKDQIADLSVRRKVFLVSIACLAGALAGAISLYRDVYVASRASDDEPIGQVLRRKSTVRRKAGTSFVWEHVSEGSMVFRGDSVQTAQSSATTLELKDGTTLDIEENSLIILENITDLSLGFVRGVAVVHKKSGGDQKISVGTDGKKKIETLPVRLIHPLSLDQFFVGGTDEKGIQFSWMFQQGGNQKLTLEVSSSHRFGSKNTKTFEPDPASPFNVAGVFGEGVYYWRIVSNGVPLSETRTFQVVSALPMQLVNPPNGTTLVSEEQKTQVQFEWVFPDYGTYSEVERAGSHQIQIAQDPDFRYEVAAQRIEASNSSAMISNLPTGYLYWRIKSQYGNLTLYSKRSLFTLSHQPKEERQPLAAPQNVKPVDGTVFDMFDASVSREATWSAVEGATLYELSIFKLIEQPDGEKIRKKVRHIRTQDNQVSLTDLEAGNYSWILFALDEDKNPGKEEPPRSFKVDYGETLAAPEVLTPEVQ